MRHWPEAIPVLLWVHAQVTSTCFRPLGNAPTTFLCIQKCREGGMRQRTSVFWLDNGVMMHRLLWEFELLVWRGVRLWLSVKCPSLCHRLHINKLELSVLTWCIYCLGLMGSSAIFLNNGSCVCSLTCPAVKVKCSQRQKSFYTQTQPLRLSISTVSAQPWLSCTFICSPVFILLHI